MQTIELKQIPECTELDTARQPQNETKPKKTFLEPELSPHLSWLLSMCIALLFWLEYSHADAVSLPSDSIQHDICLNSPGTNQSLCCMRRSHFTTLSKASIIITMTTTASRVGNCAAKSLKSLSNQLWGGRTDIALLLNIYRSFPSENIPKELWNMPQVVISVLDQDYGPLSRAIGPMLCLKHDPIVVLVDDDDYYHMPHLLRLTRALNTNLNAIYAYSGAIWNGETVKWITAQHGNSGCNKNVNSAVGLIRCMSQSVNILEGYSGVAFRKSMGLSMELREVAKAPKYCFLGDDFYLSNFWKKKHIDLRVLQIDIRGVRDHIKENRKLHLAKAAGSKGGNWDNYKACKHFLESSSEKERN